MGSGIGSSSVGEIGLSDPGSGSMAGQRPLSVCRFPNAGTGPPGFWLGLILVSVYCPRTYAKISGATIEASELIMNLGVSSESLYQVIFSLGTAPE